MLKAGDKVIDTSWNDEECEVVCVKPDMGLVQIQGKDGSTRCASLGSVIKPITMTDLKSMQKVVIDKHMGDEPKLAARYNEGKLPMHLVPTDAIKAMAGVLQVGADKYELRNWERGAYYSVPYASLMRHLTAFWEGEDIDPESGQPHIAHVLTNAAFLLRYQNEFPELDDRPNVDKSTLDKKDKK